ncbi:MAG: hypothetical protein WD200_04455 [Candidatus Andersenbacteria bacterium]
MKTDVGVQNRHAGFNLSELANWLGVPVDEVLVILQDWQYGQCPILKQWLRLGERLLAVKRGNRIEVIFEAAYAEGDYELSTPGELWKQLDESMVKTKMAKASLLSFPRPFAAVRVSNGKREGRGLNAEEQKEARTWLKKNAACTGCTEPVLDKGYMVRIGDRDRCKAIGLVHADQRCVRKLQQKHPRILCQLLTSLEIGRIIRDRVIEAEKRRLSDLRKQSTSSHEESFASWR